MKSIRSKDNPQVKALIKLAGSSRERRRTGSTILEGGHLVRAYQESGGVAETILASETALADPEVRRFFENIPARSRLELADGLLDRISQLVSSAGVAAVIKTPRPGPVPQSVSDCLLLENIQDPGNLGSILRTAVAAGVSQVFLSKSSVFAWSPKVIRAGMGAQFFLSIFDRVAERRRCGGDLPVRADPSTERQYTRRSSLNSCMIVVAISSMDLIVEFAQRIPSRDISFSACCTS